VEILVFDTGPLSHFAVQNWLGVLKAVVGDNRRAMIPDVVVKELQVGAQRDSRLQQVLEADWLEHRELTSDEEVPTQVDIHLYVVHMHLNVESCSGLLQSR